MRSGRQETLAIDEVGTRRGGVNIRGVVLGKELCDGRDDGYVVVMAGYCDKKMCTRKKVDGYHPRKTNWRIGR